MFVLNMIVGTPCLLLKEKKGFNRAFVIVNEFDIGPKIKNRHVLVSTCCFLAVCPRNEAASNHALSVCLSV